MENQLIKQTSSQTISPTTWTAMRDMAGTLLKSGFLPVAIKTPEQCLAIMMTGHELGIGPMAAIQTINVIQGKPTVSPQLMLALANRTGEVEDIKINAQNDGCTITLKRKGRSPHTESFGMAEATALNLIGKDNYKKQPAVMFKWRCLAAALRVAFPDVVLGLYSPDEMGAEVKIDTEGNMELAAPPNYQAKAEAYIAKATGEIKKPSAEAPPVNGEWPDNAPVGFLQDTSFKKGTQKNGQKWEKHGLKINDEWFGTFDTKLGAIAQTLKGQEVEYLWHQDGQYKALDNIRVLTQGPTDFPPPDEDTPEAMGMDEETLKHELGD